MKRIGISLAVLVLASWWIIGPVQAKDIFGICSSDQQMKQSASSDEVGSI